MTPAITKTAWWAGLAPKLRGQAVVHDGCAVWPRAAAQEVLRSLPRLHQRVLWAGAWVPLPQGFLIPMGRHKCTWLRDSASRDELADAMAWIRDFAFGEDFRAREPYFYFAVSPAGGHPRHCRWQRTQRREIRVASYSAPADRSPPTRN